MFLKGKFILCCNPSTRLLKCPSQIGKGEEKASHKAVPVSRICCALSPCATLAGIPGARRAGHHWSPLATAGHRWQMGSPSLLQLSCWEKRFRFPWCGTEKGRGKSRALRGHGARPRWSPPPGGGWVISVLLRLAHAL